VAACISGDRRKDGYGMTKSEFIGTLRSRLTGEVSASELENTIRYYEEYISEAMSNGKTEEQVLQELGSPLLIARTIIDTSKGKDEHAGNTQRQYYNDQKESENPGKSFYRFELNSWKGKLFVIISIVVIFFLVFTIMRVLIPVLVPLILIWFLVTMLRNGGRR